MPECALTFATGDIAREWDALKAKNRLLAEIVLQAADYAMDAHGWPLRVTCIFRPSEQDGPAQGRHGVHCVWRAVDVGAREVSETVRLDVAEFINHRYVYDPHRLGMLVAFARQHGTGPHIHFQTHERTIYAADVAGVH